MVTETQPVPPIVRICRALDGEPARAAPRPHRTPGNGTDRRDALHQPKLIQGDRDDHRDEELKESFNPQVDQLEAPVPSSSSVSQCFIAQYPEANPNAHSRPAPFSRSSPIPMHA